MSSKFGECKGSETCRNCQPRRGPIHSRGSARSATGPVFRLGRRNFKRIRGEFAVLEAVSSNVASQPNGFAERVAVGFALSRDVKACTVIRTGANHRQSCREIDASPKAQRLEWSQTLVVVHGEHAVELLERT